MTLFGRPTNVTSPNDFFISYLDGITGGFWSVLIPVLVFTITYMTLNQFGSRQAFAAGSFATLVTVVMLLGLGVLSSQALIVAIILVVIAVVINNGGVR